jgi:hypothetical protein
MKQINEPQKELDRGQALVFLEKALGEKGADYVYTLGGRDVKTYNEQNSHTMRCQYFEDGQPSCLVGHVLSYMGYNERVVPEHDSASNVVNTVLGISTGIDVLQALDKAQELQDTGYTWGEAVEAAKEILQ